MARYYLLFAFALAAIFALWDRASVPGEDYPVPLGLVNCVIGLGTLQACTEVTMERLDSDTADDRQQSVGIPG